MSLYLELLGLVLFLLGSGFFSGVETGVISINKIRLQHLVRENNKAAHIIQTFLAQPDLILGTTLVGTNLCNVALSIVSTGLAISLIGFWGNWVAPLLLTPTLLILGEYLPKAWFQSRPLARTLRCAGAIKFFGVVFYPLSWAVIQLAKVLIRAPSNTHAEKAYQLTRQELQRLISSDSGTATAHLSDQKKEMIQGVFQLPSTRCAEIMVLRKNMVILGRDVPVSEALDLARTTSLMRFPVYADENDGFVGIVHVMDLLQLRNTPKASITSVMRPPKFINEKMPIDELIPRMQMSRQPMLLVQNDRGEVVGLVTLDEILSTFQV